MIKSSAALQFELFKGRLASGYAARLILAMFVFVHAPAVHADIFSPFKKLFSDNDELVIWEAPGQYVKVVDQDWMKDHKHPPKNKHPVKLNPRQLAVALASLYVFLSQDSSGKKVQVFTMDQVALLSGKLVEALDKAHPDQDVVFAISDNQYSTAGRLFFTGGNLNIILGDVLQAVDGKPDSSDVSYYDFPHRAGKRWKPVEYSTQIVTAQGIRYAQIKTQRREDWVVIDIPAVMAAYQGPQIPVAVTAPTQTAAPASPDASESVDSSTAGACWRKWHA